MNTTLRDLFAAAALARAPADMDWNLLTHHCWALADEMLRTRGTPLDEVPQVVEPDDIEALRADIIHAYEEGKFVQYRIDLDSDWCDAQKGFLPIDSWHWDKYDYRIKPK